jgi:hypothetical protein
VTLRRVREAAGVSTRRVPRNPEASSYFTSGHISLVEAGRTAPSSELIEAYVELGGNRAELRSLYEQMLTATRTAARERRSGRPPERRQTPPTCTAEIRDRHDVQQHYVVESEDVHYAFSPTGAIQDVECTVLLRALNAGVKIYYIGFNYPADAMKGRGLRSP